MLGFSGVSRHAEVHAKKSVDNIKEGKIDNLLLEMANSTNEAIIMLAKEKEMRIIGELLDTAWNIKRNLADGVTQKWIDNIYFSAIENGAYGGKLMGAGGGGFFMFLVPPNLQEHFILALHLMQKLPIENFILPVVFDDLRENKIRKGVENIFNDEISKNFIVGSSATGKRLYNNYLNNNKTQSFQENKAQSFQENTEKYLDKNLEKIWTLWSIRQDLRGRLIIFLHKTRNYVFNINASTIRKMLPSNYTNNFLAIEDLMKVLNSKRIKTLIYVAPIRDDYKIPYNLNEYNKFKKDLEYLSKKNNIKFKNFENIIPGFLWGKKQAISFDKKNELDFMHIPGVGHDMLTNSIYQEIVKLID